jgi:hypothetical protein
METSSIFSIGTALRLKKHFFMGWREYMLVAMTASLSRRDYFFNIKQI